MMQQKNMTKKRSWNIRKQTITIITIATILLIVILGSGILVDTEAIEVQLENRNEEPSLEHLFGTDWLGRDMLARTLKGLTLSFSVGILAAFCSTLIAFILSLLSTWNRIMNSIITWLIDLFLGIPHIVLLILISFALAGGFKGVVIGLALTHWPSLTRLLRAEVMQVMQSDYVAVSRKLGKTKTWIAWHHIFPVVLPQLLIGFILMFPHAILHEAAITFLGFGLSAETPAIGIILEESMQYLSTGMWWLAFFPGLSLLFMVAIFDILGRNIRRLLDPFQSSRL